jgi:hypothetical protein
MLGRKFSPISTLLSNSRSAALQIDMAAEKNLLPPIGLSTD